MKTNLLLSSSVYVLGTFLTQGVNFFALIFFARLMSPEEYGKFAIYVFWNAIVQIFIGLRTQSSINNAYIDFGKQNIYRFASDMSFITLGSFAVFVIPLYIFSGFSAELVGLPFTALILGVVQAFFIYYVHLIAGIYRIEERPLPYLLYSLANVFLDAALSCIWVFMLSSDKYMGKVYGSLVSAILTGGIAALVIHRRSNFKLKLDPSYVKYALVFSLPLILHGLASVFNGKVDAWFLMKLKSSGDAGVYSFSGNFGHVIYVLYTACNLAFIPWYYKKKAAGRDDTVTELIKQYIGIFAFIFLSFLCLIPEVIDLLGTEAYGKAKYYVPGVSLGFFFNFLYNFPTNYLFYKKRTNLIAVTTCTTFFLNFIGNYFLIKHFGIKGAMLTAALTPLSYLIINYVFAKYVVKDYEIPGRFFVIPAIIMFGMTILYYCLLPYIIVRYAIVLAGILLLGRYYWKKYKSGELLQMVK
ncbi:MAG: oligosaccharide flippase family protein [Lentisphaeria bacterium]|nr:oligosaccharide flippase family protein [Lentisphaeria bacterium]